MTQEINIDETRKINMSFIFITTLAKDINFNAFRFNHYYNENTI